MHKVMTSWNVSRAGLIEQKKSESCQKMCATEVRVLNPYMPTRKIRPPTISPNSTEFGSSKRTEKGINEEERGV